MHQKNYITVLGYTRLKDELHQLVSRERPTLVDTVNWAAGNGDRSENGDYIYGKRRLREIDKRIRALIHKLENAEAVDPIVHAGSEKIFFGARVTILKNNEIRQTITIVGQDEIDPGRNYVSWTAPLARALLRKEIGEYFEFVSLKGTDSIEIIDVNYVY